MRPDSFDTLIVQLHHAKVSAPDFSFGRFSRPLPATFKLNHIRLLVHEAQSLANKEMGFRILLKRERDRKHGSIQGGLKMT